MRDVIEEDHPQADAAEEIEPKVALDRSQESCRFPVDHGSAPFSKDSLKDSLAADEPPNQSMLKSMQLRHLTRWLAAKVSGHRLRGKEALSGEG
ncbi:hypothetical protein GCM10007857_40630 [Bradyrhizobium iriomotense]|uniref:Uncharacterized protein n=1 Tax=Bradyrhizobium iriomotense TaxID=441950 RepID=A0ABQ6AYT7_9BRAD|nr:hypothetical protein GCM10007857_40630 [Bradyrhizobium iriomotense]